MNGLALLFSFRGRLDRRRFWLGMAAVVCLSVAGLWWPDWQRQMLASRPMFLPYGEVFPPALKYAVLFVLLFLWLAAPSLLAMYMAAALIVKHLRDRGRTGWWAVPTLVASALAGPGYGSLPSLAAWIVIGLVATTLAFAFLELFVLGPKSTGIAPSDEPLEGARFRL